MALDTDLAAVTTLVLIFSDFFDFLTSCCFYLVTFGFDTIDDSSTLLNKSCFDLVL